MGKVQALGFFSGGICTDLTGMIEFLIALALEAKRRGVRRGCGDGWLVG